MYFKGRNRIIYLYTRNHYQTGSCLYERGENRAIFYIWSLELFCIKFGASYCIFGVEIRSLYLLV